MNKGIHTSCKLVLAHKAHSAFWSTYHIDEGLRYSNRPISDKKFLLKATYDCRHSEGSEIATWQWHNVPVENPPSPGPPVARDPPTPVAGHVETSGAIYNIFTPSYEGISLCFSPLSSLASLLTVAMALWINDITSVCMLARVFVCGDESWNLQTEWTQLANIRWRAEA